VTHIRRVVHDVAMTQSPASRGSIPSLTLGWRLRMSLDYANISVQQMAHQLGVSRTTLSRWMADKGDEIAKLAATFPIVGLWFPSPLNPTQPVKPLAVSATIKAAMASVGIVAVPHQLRDTAATMMQRQTHDLTLTQNFLRHASPATTTKYIGVSDAALQAAARSIRWDAA
jgi:integrase